MKEINSAIWDITTLLGTINELEERYYDTLKEEEKPNRRVEQALEYLKWLAEDIMIELREKSEELDDIVERRF